MKVNTRTRGAKHVNEAITIFKDLGYNVWKPGNRAHFIGPGKAVSQSQDILEAFDFIAIHPHTRVVLVQVTTIKKGDSTGTATVRRKKIDKLNVNLNHICPIVMGRLPRKKWKIWGLGLTGWFLYDSLPLEILKEGDLDG